MSEVTDAKTLKVIRPDSSQRFPSIPLAKAIERVREMYKVAATHEVPMVTAGKGWGYSEKSSGIAMTVSSLKYFGLLEDSGSNENRKVKLTEAALKIIRDPREISPDRDSLLRHCALLPPIHREIVEKYNGMPPSDDAFKAYLLLDRSFKDDAAIDFIKEFTATMAYAKISDSSVSSETDSELEESKDPSSQATQSMTAANLPSHASVVIPQNVPGTRRAVFALAEGDVTIIFPEKLSAESVSDLSDYLEIFMKKAKRETSTSVFD